MWIISKKVGVFTHYLTNTGTFQPGIERASKFPSKEMADILARKHGGIVTRA
ncbi:hypothetical protein V0288_20570 [Pannus brasiliensis CCIBt3594]|uniref:Uncharacterized protein n=1 Tax=Pannus brasiliensis CCIBt3594 TaxID=1427578 RepID=A0AAW9QWE9_9CHRO